MLLQSRVYWSRLLLVALAALLASACEFHMRAMDVGGSVLKHSASEGASRRVAREAIAEQLLCAKVEPTGVETVLREDGASAEEAHQVVLLALARPGQCGGVK